ncbi:MAG: hypothetical protein EP298_07625 [Gammaproteobacteria bacterium]|nr:MAG: hypothetical protein EP298_07625 [Gammaproteobacteria bacterium]UTW43697.1 hypothetical protein KFE69_06295 [bacterium SCSIO 12844]
MGNQPVRRFDAITYRGKILFSDLFFSQHLTEEGRTFFKPDKANEVPRQFAFPLGYSTMFDDFLLLFEKKEESITRYGVAFSFDYFVVFTLVRTPFMSEGKMVGIVNNVDYGYHQLIFNPCYQEIMPLPCQYDRLTKNEMQLLFLLAQFPELKAKDITGLMDVQIRTAYMYKYDLINKLKDIFHQEQLNFVELINKIFHVEVPKPVSDTQNFIVLPKEEFLSHCDLLSKDKSVQTLRYENNFDESTLQRWVDIFKESS